MLIEFSVSNYRSFREKQTFSMVAAPRLRKKENVLKANIKGEKFPDLLKVAAIYGPNASGKSNLIEALGFVNDLANGTPNTQGKPLAVSPFRFDPQLVGQPSRFEIHFIAGNQRYEFDLALTRDRIIEERLVTFPKGKEELLYKRQYSTAGEHYEFGTNLEGGPALHDAWKKLTNPKMLFISQAVANSSEELQQLKIPFNWLQNALKSVPRDLEPLANVVQTLAKIHPELALSEFIPAFLREVDVPVIGIQFEQGDNASEVSTFKDIDYSDFHNEKLRPFIESYRKVKTTLTHRTALGEADFDFSEESDGTKNLIGFSLPWQMLSGNKTGTGSFVVDELDSSLHPKIVASLIEKLLKTEFSSQFIFTTHDTHLMDTKLLRRDQFWLTERNMNGATELRSIHDFVGRESEDVEKRYYEGRYRALPILKKSPTSFSPTPNKD